MSTETDKELVQRLYNEFYVRRNEAVWDELVHPDVVIHGIQGAINGTEAAKALYTTQFFAALQPWTFRIDDIIIDWRNHDQRYRIDRCWCQPPKEQRRGRLNATKEYSPADGGLERVLPGCSMGRGAILSYVGMHCVSPYRKDTSPFH
jgi:hypothetical protein